MSEASRTVRPRWLAPEVVQTSAMDCGPASLKCLLEGFGINVSYGRLREACQTDVDGTSIDTLEEVACQLGLEAEQVVVPVDHVLRSETRHLPALAVTQLPNGLTHFVVVWKRLGPWLQVMDPGTGRQWVNAHRFLDELYIHTMPVEAEDWYEWAQSEDFLDPLQGRLQELGLSKELREKLVGQAIEVGTWFAIAALDAATRMVTSLTRAGGVKRGHHAGQLLLQLWLEARQQDDSTISQQDSDEAALARYENASELGEIPRAYWTVWPAPGDEDGVPQVFLRGAVLVRVLGHREKDAEDTEDAEAASHQRLSPELAAALEEPPSRPGLDLFRMLREDGLLTPVLLLFLLGLAAFGVLFEALLFRGFFELGTMLSLPEQRLAAHLGIIAFGVAMLLLEVPMMMGILRMGRHLEARLRLAFLQKIPRLGDRYFQSRLRSDMAERSHSVQVLRSLPNLGSQWLRSVFELLLTTAGIIWLAPNSAVLTIIVAAVSITLPLCLQPLQFERDMRTRAHAGSLSRFYLDALLGLFAIRAHGAEKAVKREHESMLVDWASAGLGLQNLVVWLEGIQAFVSVGLIGWLLFHHLSQGGQPASVLLLVYWSLSLPVLGQKLAELTRQYPAIRNVTLRLLEPLGAPEADTPTVTSSITTSAITKTPQTSQTPEQGVAICLDNVWVQAAGHTILSELSVSIEPGEHVAVVGSSGAGKSSLVGLLLGWHRPAQGRLLVDGQPLSGTHLEQLRRETAWVDPDVQIWNRSFLENLMYGNEPSAKARVGQVLEAATLHNVLEILPEGLQTSLGEGGALLSGGQGQRVRLGRAMLRNNARLVILDEPFRGLDRERRHQLLQGVRDYWQSPTILCITHDVGDTLSFPRVLVIDNGCIVEDGNPAALAAQPDSRYHALLQAEQELREGLWTQSNWRQIWIHSGHLSETTGASEVEG